MYISLSCLSLRNFNTPRRSKMWKSRVNDGVAYSAADDHVVVAAVDTIGDMISDVFDRCLLLTYLLTWHFGSSVDIGILSIPPSLNS